VTRVVRHLLIIGALALLALPAAASASPDQVIRDCGQDDKLDRKYSNEDLRKARDNLPSDLDEYSNCREVINQAIKGGSDKGGGAGSPGVGATDPEGETAARAQDASDLEAIAGGTGGSGSGKPPSVDVGGSSLEPDRSGYFSVSDAANEVPLPLVAAMILLGLLVLASGIGALRERIPALARIPLLSKIPTPRVPFLKGRS
jgi:hypothetical protein